MLGFGEWLLIGAAALLGFGMMNKHERAQHIPDHALTMAKGPIRRKMQPGDVIFMQNFSPYAYEPDGNLL